MAPTATAEIIVAGLGTAGSATCRELARRGTDVLGIDACAPPHQKSGHHGLTRSIRKAYLEGTSYVPMVQRAWELWQQLERDSAQTLLLPTANLTIGAPDCPAVTGFFRSAAAYAIAHQQLSAAEIRRRWPQLNVADGLVGGLEVEAGILLAEHCIALLLRQARESGARLKVHEELLEWRETTHGVLVTTTQGQYVAERLLLSTGFANRRLLGGLGEALQPKLVPVHWLQPKRTSSLTGGGGFRYPDFPVNFWQLEVPGGRHGQYTEFYSLPIVAPGFQVKFAPHNNLDDLPPGVGHAPVQFNRHRQRAVSAMTALITDHLPGLDPSSAASTSCVYTLTPDNDFVLGPLPGSERVFTAALGGHGFKFAPVLGEILADLLTDTTPRFDLTRFAPNRFAAG